MTLSRLTILLAVAAAVFAGLTVKGCRDRIHADARVDSLLAGEQAFHVRMNEMGALIAAMARQDSVAHDTTVVRETHYVESKASAQALRDTLKVLTTARDSIKALVALSAADSLALARADAAIASLHVELGVVRARAALLDSARVAAVARVDSVTAGLRLARKDCRIPLVGLPCPVLSAGYGAVLSGDGKVRHGVTLAVGLPIRF